MPAPIRTATGHDLPALLRLYRQLNPSDPVLSAADAAAAWARMQAQPGLAVLVADAGGAAVATCTLVVVANLTRGARPYGVVENVVTDADHRRQGHGRAVLDAAVARAWALDCYKVMLMTGSRRDSTLRFYANAGFSRDKTAFQIRNPHDA